MKEISEVTYLEVNSHDVQTFRDFLEVIENNGFCDDGIYHLMLAIANKNDFAKFDEKDENSIFAKITYTE
jgi:hypothetical protein